jgi:hypothetical protein
MSNVIGRRARRGEGRLKSVERIVELVHFVIQEIDQIGNFL